ncbi:MAG: tryptophan 7-halogenase, partial [Rhodobacteraceae bacterium]|nr:tryptophan 7-halogenase [Paracoccaceae bacterium]
EPLESTSIHLIQRGITRLVQMFPDKGIREPAIVEFNAKMQSEIYNIRDFLIFHYHVTNRSDTPFWRQGQTMDIPDSLTHRIKLFRQTGRIAWNPGELFSTTFWVQLMLGQGLIPEQYHPVVNAMSKYELGKYLVDIHRQVEKHVNQLPDHQRFIDDYCKAQPI